MSSLTLESALRSLSCLAVLQITHPPVSGESQINMCTRKQSFISLTLLVGEVLSVIDLA